ncbi:hypothetical protein [Legionella spiritensis]|uniref:Uncharacterized protein n=1 Tax=Legionella spiritensis TaxID=452 RepID=A0A0W0Z962_LEGSP|nr:hypothetical protein [Legionella spiritensis]KTD65454.1 hypothetical protein Lspi_0528 [Legionella spiritensis]SNV35738.1 Uncharacterised protein [Legionella spiritensis]
MKYGEDYAGGLALDFFESAGMESLDGLAEQDKALVIARNVLRVLTMGGEESWQNILNRKTINAVLIERDHDLTRALRLAFQQGFHHVYSQLQNRELDLPQHRQAELFISNCLMLLPFGDITPYEFFSIPQWVNNRWQLIDYQVVPIELTPTSGFKKLFLSDNDRVFAYGLEPVNHAYAEPHLIFMGTTYPAGQGFFPQVNSDLESFETAGKKLYRSGRERIVKWMERQGRKIHVCGASLGGALSLLLALDQGARISRVDALNPPGLYNSWRKSRFDRWDETVEKPPVYIQKQGSDLVSRFGIWKEGWRVIHVIPPEKRRRFRSLMDHALMYTGLAETTFKSVDTQADNEERKVRDFLLYTIARSAVYYGGLVPYRYVVLPVMRYAWEHKFQIGLFLALSALFLVVPLFPAGLFIPLLPAVALVVINAVLAAFLVSYLLDNLFGFVLDQYGNKTQSDFSRLADWIRKQPAWVTPVFAIGALSLAASTIITLFVAPLVAMAIPVVTLFVFKSWSLMRTWLGFNEVTQAKCHDPQLPRNENMDIYINKLDASLSLQELGDYYFAKRCLLADKPYIPGESDKRREQYDGLSKHELITQCASEKASLKRVNVHASRAKIHEIRQMAALVNRFGIHHSQPLSRENAGSLMDDLHAIETSYQQGKLASVAG